MTDQDNDIFDNKDQPKTAEQQTTEKPASSDQEPKTPIDYNEVFKDHLTSIIGDNGEPKYKDVPTALAALKASQEYIRTLEGENQTYKTKSVQNETMEEVLQRFAEKQSPAKKDNTDSTKSRELDVDQLKEKFNEWAQQTDQEKAFKTNQRAVSEALVKQFGDVEKGRKAFEDKARELGLDIDTFTTLAARSPKAVLSYFEISASNTPKFNVQGSVNTDALKPQPQKPQIGGIMFGASSEEMVAAWKAAGQAVMSQTD